MFDMGFNRQNTSRVKRFATGAPTKIKQGITNAMKAARNKAIAAQMLQGNTNKVGIGGLARYGASQTAKLYKPAKNTLKRLVGGFGRSKLTMGGSALLGAIGMAGLAIMNGAMGHAQDSVNERYMRDARYSSKLLSSTRLGSTSGQPQLNIGNHAGLALALHKGRHS